MEGGHLSCWLFFTRKFWCEWQLWCLDEIWSPLAWPVVVCSTDGRAMHTPFRFRWPTGLTGRTWLVPSSRLHIIELLERESPFLIVRMQSLPIALSLVKFNDSFVDGWTRHRRVHSRRHQASTIMIMAMHTHNKGQAFDGQSQWWPPTPRSWPKTTTTEWHNINSRYQGQAMRKGWAIETGQTLTFCWPVGESGHCICLLKGRAKSSSVQ